MLLRAILAAVIGTVAMTLSSTTEMQWVERPASVVPGLATAKLLRPFGIKEVKGRALPGRRGRSRPGSADIAAGMVVVRSSCRLGVPGP